MRKIIINVMITSGLLMILIGFGISKKESINTLFNHYFSSNNPEVILDDVNKYYRDYDFLFVQNTNNFRPTNYQELLNVYYTVINAGKDSFTFYCDTNYENCIKDVDKIANDKVLLSDINNFVHPYNAFSNIETEYDTLGKITIKLTKSYTNNDINKINKKINELYPKLVNNSNTLENIKSVHDYIINNAKYDSNRSDLRQDTYKSDIAYGPLFQGYAICGGYTDLMQLFLEKMNIKSYRVSSDTHIWNAVYINNKWYNLDLTWDDPVVSDGLDYLKHDYFLISTNELLEKEKTQHDFNKNVFIEVKGTN